jgi:hypothetical protein
MDGVPILSDAIEHLKVLLPHINELHTGLEATQSEQQLIMQPGSTIAC